MIARLELLGLHTLRQYEGTGESSILYLLMEVVPVLLLLLPPALALEGGLVVGHRELNLFGIDPGDVRFDADGVPVQVTVDLRDISCRHRAPRHAGPVPAAEAEELIYIAGGIEGAEGDVPSGQCFHHFALLPFAQLC